MQQPFVFKPTIFLIVSNILPTAGAAMFFFFTEHLGFTAGFMGHMQVVGGGVGSGWGRRGGEEVWGGGVGRSWGEEW